MATVQRPCYKCKKPIYYSNTGAFRVQCSHCKTIIESPDGVEIWHNLSEYIPIVEPQSVTAFDKQLSTDNKIVLYMFGVPVGILIIEVIILAVNSITGKVHDFTSDNNLSNIPAAQNVQSLSPLASSQISKQTLTTPSSSLNVYSGNCTYYKKAWANADSNNVHYEPLSTGFAKVVINRTSKKLYFYYNGKLVFHYFGYLSDTDSVNGGEGFTFDSDADAHRYLAERTFILNTERMFSDLGYQYAITNYKEN